MLGLFDRYLVLRQAQVAGRQGDLLAVQAPADSFILDWALEEVATDQSRTVLDGAGPVETRLAGAGRRTGA